MISKAQVQALAAGDAWLEKGANLLCFGPPGGGKSNLAAALGMALIEKGWRVLFTRTTDVVQKLQIARRDLLLEAAIAKLDKCHLLILDDLAYVTKDPAETSVLFELISARYERRSMLITANQPFGEWRKIFPDQALTLAAIDRLVHHATILEMNVDSYCRKRLSTKRAERDVRHRARQSKADPDGRSTTIKSRVKKISLALSPCRDKYPIAATAEMASRLSLVFPSRLSRYRLMTRMGLAPIYQHPKTSEPHPRHKIHPYLLRHLTIEAPNYVWCADVTSIPMRRGFLYFVAITD